MLKQWNQPRLSRIAEPNNYLNHREILPQEAFNPQPRFREATSIERAFSHLLPR
jgi:hypothetical protein